MIINHNMASLNAWRNLQNTNENLNTSLERLSSGLRINRAADDAAGLAISEKMRAQINGLTQAISNAQNGISLLQTAEGALGTSESILQRMRQLALGSAADSASASDRQQNQKEMDQLANELSRISNTTEFNTKNLLGGAFNNQSFQIGANANQAVQFSIGAMDASALGVTAQKGVTVADGNLATSAYLGTGATATTQAYQVTGTATAATADNTSVSQTLTSAVYKSAWAADSVSVTMGTGATGTGGGAGDGYTISYVDGAAGVVADSVAVNGKNITVTIKNAGDTAANIATAMQTGLRTALGDNTIAVSSTGVTAALTSVGITNSQPTTGLDVAAVQFNAANAGANSGLKVVLTAGAPTSGNASAAYTSATGTVTITYGASAKVSDILSAVNNNSSVSAVMTASSSSAPNSAWGTAKTSTALAGGTDASLSLNLLDANGATVQSGVSVSSGYASFSNVGLNVAISQSVANTLSSGNIAAQTIEVVTDNSKSAVAGTAGVLNSQATVAKGILVDTSANSNAALTAIDTAINKVSTARATLGALQNRLNNTVANLGTTSDNMTAAESRIRDVDMAKEMANFTRTQILMQAGTAMLAQANQVPQSTLKLLQ